MTPFTVFTVNVPGTVGTPEIVTLPGFNGPPVSLHNTQIPTGVFLPVVVTSGLANGGVPVTVTVTFALVQLIGKIEHT
jgi:hypothetical protein